jgi:uncharacterized membrane protein YiaA
VYNIQPGSGVPVDISCLSYIAISTTELLIDCDTELATNRPQYMLVLLVLLYTVTLLGVMIWEKTILKKSIVARTILYFVMHGG